MLKNIQKSSLKTLDELSVMASVAEKIANLESKEGDSQADDTAAAAAAAAATAASSNPPNSDQLQEGEEEEEGGGQETRKAEKYTTYDPKKFVSLAGYNRYREDAHKLVTPSRQFRLTFEDALEKLGPNSSTTKEGADIILKDIEDLYHHLLVLRKVVTNYYTLEAKEEDTYIDKFFHQRQKIREMYDAKYMQPLSGTNSVTSRKNSIHQSTALEPESNEQVNLQKIEDERKKAEEAQRAIDEANRSLLQRRENLVRELASCDRQHRVLMEGSRSSSPCPSISSSCVAPLNDILEEKIEMVQPPKNIVQNFTPKMSVFKFNCRFCDAKFESLESADLHEKTVHKMAEPAAIVHQAATADDVVPPPTTFQGKEVPKSLSEEQFLKHLQNQNIAMAQWAIESFDPKKIITKPFKGDDPINNYQNYSQWRTKWNKVEKKATRLGIEKSEMYTYLLEVLDGPALEVADVTEEDENTYELMLARLDKRYSNPTLYLKEVTKTLDALPQMKDERNSLMHGINTLEKGWHNLKSRKLSNDDILTMYFLNCYEPKLSPKSRTNWATFRTKRLDDSHPLGYNVTIDDFFKCVRETETHLLLSESSKSVETQNNNKKNDKKKDEKPGIFGAHATSSGQDSSSKQKCTIPNCPQNKHKYMLKCPQLPKMTSEEVNSWCKKNNITCKLCLDSSEHKSKDCPGLENGGLQRCQKVIQEGPRANQICNGFHCVFVHFDVFPNKQGRRNQTHQTATSANSEGQQADAERA